MFCNLSKMHKNEVSIGSQNIIATVCLIISSFKTYNYFFSLSISILTNEGFPLIWICKIKQAWNCCFQLSAAFVLVNYHHVTMLYDKKDNTMCTEFIDLNFVLSSSPYDLVQGGPSLDWIRKSRKVEYKILMDRDLVQFSHPRWCKLCWKSARILSLECYCWSLSNYAVWKG